MAADLELEAQWQRVLGRWDDESMHAAFLQRCRDAGLLGEAAARYASMRDDAARGPSAQKKLAAITVLATASLLAMKTAPKRALPRWIVVAVLAACLLAMTYTFLRVW